MYAQQNTLATYTKNSAEMSKKKTINLSSGQMSQNQVFFLSNRSVPYTYTMTG